MKNWSIDEKNLAKYSEQYELWKLEQMINYGLEGKRLSRRVLAKNLSKLSIDSQKKKYLNYLLRSK